MRYLISAWVSAISEDIVVKVIPRFTSILSTSVGAVDSWPNLDDGAAKEQKGEMISIESY